MQKPISLQGLPDYLLLHPAVSVTNFDGTRETANFLDSYPNGMWFAREDGRDFFLPMNCHITEKASLAEAGIDIDDRRFSLTKFGKTIRVDYLEEPA